MPAVDALSVNLVSAPRVLGKPAVVGGGPAWGWWRYHGSGILVDRGGAHLAVSPPIRPPWTATMDPTVTQPDAALCTPGTRSRPYCPGSSARSSRTYRGWVRRCSTS